MPDREKVIKGLMELHGSKETMTIISDAIALLKLCICFSGVVGHAVWP